MSRYLSARDLDWVLLIGTVCVTLFGAVLVWSASRADMARMVARVEGIDAAL